MQQKKVEFKQKKMGNSQDRKIADSSSTLPQDSRGYVAKFYRRRDVPVTIALKGTNMNGAKVAYNVLETLVIVSSTRGQVEICRGDV